MKQNHNIQWTAIFIVATGADSDMEDDCRYLFNELLSTDLHDNIKIAICINTQVINLNQIDSNYPNQNKLDDGKSTSVIYTLQKSTTKQGNELKYIVEIENFEIQEETDIALFLKACIEFQFKSDRYILFTWDHGSMYGIFERKISITQEKASTEAEVANLEKLTSIISNAKIRNYLDDNSIDKNFTKNVNIDLNIDYIDTTPEMLTNRDLCVAIKEAFGKKIEVLVMTNCFMQEFDTGYELLSAVEYLVAPVTFIDMFGFNYKAILGKIARHPEISSKKIAKIAIKSYKNKCLKIPKIEDRQNALNKSVISAVDLKYYSKIGALLDKMAIILISKLDTELPKIISARQSISFLTGGGESLIVADPWYFLNDVAKKLNDKQFSKYINIFNQIYMKTVKYKYVGSSFKPIGPYTEYRDFRPHGFTIYFPFFRENIALPLNKFIDDNTNNPDVDSFAKNTSWDKFVITFARKVPADFSS